MAVGQEHFEDPKLKAALQKAFSGEHASGALRARVLRAVQMAALEEMPVETKPSRDGQRPSWVRYAVATTMFMGAVFAVVLNWDYWSPSFTPGEAAPALPQVFTEAMLAAHASPLPTEFATREAAETKLSAQFAHKVAIPDLPGWTFKGAHALTIASQPTAHAVYQRNEAKLSLFCIISESCGISEGTSYDEVCSNIVIAGFQRKGLNACLLTTPATPDMIVEVNKLRDHLAKGQ